MPRLLVFAPCEKVLIDQSNNPSLISLMQQWAVESQTDVPDNAFVPIRWDIFTLWLRIDGDDGREFTQYCDLVSPVGNSVTSANIDFTMNAVTHRNIVSLMGLPANPGQYELRLYLGEKGSKRDGAALATYPLVVGSPSRA